MKSNYLRHRAYCHCPIDRIFAGNSLSTRVVERHERRVRASHHYYLQRITEETAGDEESTKKSNKALQTSGGNGIFASFGFEYGRLCTTLPPRRRCGGHVDFVVGQFFF